MSTEIKFIHKTANIINVNKDFAKKISPLTSHKRTTSLTATNVDYLNSSTLKLTFKIFTTSNLVVTTGNKEN